MRFAAAGTEYGVGLFTSNPTIIFVSNNWNNMSASQGTDTLAF